MTEMQQNLVGMHELEAERLAQATQQELARSQAGVKGKGKGAAVPLQEVQGMGAFASKHQPQPFEGEDDKWREWARVFRSWSGRFFGGALSEIYEHVVGHRNDSASILDLALTSLRFDAGFLRNLSTVLHHVLIMLTRGRQSGRGWKRIDFSSDDTNQFSTVTTVSKLVDLLASTYSGDLVDSLTDFQRRVTSWEHDAKATLSDLISIGSCHPRFWRKVVFGIVC